LLLLLVLLLLLIIVSYASISEIVVINVVVISCYVLIYWLPALWTGVVPCLYPPLYARCMEVMAFVAFEGSHFVLRVILKQTDSAVVIVIELVSVEFELGQSLNDTLYLVSLQVSPWPVVPLPPQQHVDDAGQEAYDEAE
jgi:hypothetical protein